MEEAFADSPYDVTLEIINFVNGAAAVEAAQAGELDILTSGDQMITTAILENGLPFKVIGNNYVNKKYAFVASKKSGIAFAANLKGTKVGVTVGNNQYMATLAFLEDNGYSIEDLEAVNLSTADRYTALLSGDIDWTLLQGKTRENMLNEEGGILLGYNGDYKFNECVFGVSDSFAAQYPEVVTTLVKTFYDATEYANGNTDVVSEILKKIMTVMMRRFLMCSQEMLSMLSVSLKKSRNPSRGRSIMHIHRESIAGKRILAKSSTLPIWRKREFNNRVVGERTYEE